MKYKFVLTALALIPFCNSCMRPESMPGYSDVGAILTFTAGQPQTRTEWDGSTIVWSKGDRMSLAYARDGQWSSRLHVSEPLEATAAKSAFTVKTDLYQGGQEI